MRTIFILFSGIILLAGCSKEVIEPELLGSIEGKVTDGQTGDAISGVSIETTPATQAITTDDQGNFELNGVATGSYMIKASKSRYDSKSVNVQVREDKTSSANIVLEGGENDVQFLQAEVTSWRQTGQPDTSKVEVEYRLENISNSTSLGYYEVYFDIYNNQETLYYEVADTTLHPDEVNIGNFTKPVKDAVVDSIKVSGTWVKDQ